jgi:hypothetical protein
MTARYNWGVAWFSAAIIGMPVLIAATMLV